MNTLKLFLASSAELQADRQAFEIFINRKNKDWASKGVFLHLDIWEDFLDAMSQTRLQDEYNKAVRGCDIFVMLFCSKVGKYTAEEFSTAFGQFQATGKPFVFTYFKDDPAARGKASREDLQSLWAFQDRLKDLGHFQTVYPGIEDLKYQFGSQLDKLAANGFIEFSAETSTPALNPQVTVGERGVYIGGNSTGTVVTGTQVNTGGGAYVGGNVSVTGGDFVGRDKK